MSLMFEFDTFMSEKIKPNFGKGKLKDIEEVHYQLSKFLRKWEKKQPKPNGNLIIDDFLNLQTFIGQNLMLMVEMTSNGFGTEYPEAFEETVRLLSDSTLGWLNIILKDIAGKFEGHKEFKEFEPFKLLNDKKEENHDTITTKSV